MSAASLRRRVTPGAIHLGVALVALAVIAPLALSAAQTAPPAIAEFAPQLQVIKKAPTQQPGSEGGLGAAATPTPAPTPTPSGPGAAPSLPPGAVVSHCVGNPPRQTEDPQSPPCVPYWSGNNGGATSFGVTGSDINVAIPEFAFGDPTADADVVKFFNLRYQFYGRHITPKFFIPQDNLSGPPNPNVEDSDAQKVQDMQAFASTGTGFRQGAEFLYYDALARRHIIAVSESMSSRQTEAHLASYAPYEWSFQTPIDLSMRNWGEFVCKVLVGKPPAYAAGAQATQAVRSFGEIIVRPADGSIPDDSPLLQALDNCGASSINGQRYEVDDNGSGADSTQARNAFISMQQAHVTSVICTCFFSDLNGTFMQDASSQGFQPEWVTQSYGGNDVEDAQGQATPDQKLHQIGISFLNKTQPQTDAPWYWAVHEADPSYAAPASDGYGETSLYQMLLVLASGIQAAGPDLTPQTFAQGIQGLRYPNPGCGQAPYYQACVGFDGGFTMVASATMVWHDPRQQGTVDSSRTAVCYVDAGRRYALGEWPAEAPRFYGSVCR